MLLIWVCALCIYQAKVITWDSEFYMEWLKWLHWENGVIVKLFDEIEEKAKEVIIKSTKSQLRSNVTNMWQCTMGAKYDNMNELMQSVQDCWGTYTVWWETGDYFVIIKIATDHWYEYYIFVDNSTDCSKPYNQMRRIDYNFELAIVDKRNAMRDVIRKETWLKTFEFDYRRDLTRLSIHYPATYEKYEEDIKDALQWECRMHEGKRQCLQAVKNLNKFVNTTENDDYRFNFDGSTEYLETYVVVSSTEWLNWPMVIWWNRVLWNYQLLIAWWAQEDEVFAKYKDLFDFINKMEKELDTKVKDISLKIDNYIQRMTEIVMYVVMVVCFISIVSALWIKLRK